MTGSLCFDFEVSSDFRKACSDVSKVLDDYWPRLGYTINQVSVSFVGPYANVLALHNRWRAITRPVLLRGLDALVEDLKSIEAKATDEQERADSYLRLLEKLNEGDQSVDPLSLQRLSVPVKPPVLSTSNFIESLYGEYVLTGQPASIVSAVPNDLRSFADGLDQFDTDLSASTSNLKAALASYKSACGWVNVEGMALIDSQLDAFVSANKVDRDFLNTAAKEFEQLSAGGMGIDGTKSISTTALSFAVAYAEDTGKGVVDILTNPGLTDAELTAATRMLAHNPKTAKSVGEYVAHLVKDADSSALEAVDDVWLFVSKYDVAKPLPHVIACLKGISGSSQASAYFLQSMGGNRFLDILDNSITQYCVYTSQGRDFAEQLRSVFLSGINNLDARQQASFASGLCESYQKRGTEYYDHNFAFYYLLDGGTKLPTPFLLTAATGIEAYDKNNPNASNSVLTDEDTNIIWHDFAPNQPLSSQYDVGVGLMKALSKNPEAALDFFTGKNSDGSPLLSDAEVIARQKYWIEQRPWATDKFTGITGALEAIATSPETQYTQSATNLIGRAVSLLAQHNGSKSEQFVPGNLSKAASISLANMIHPYMAEISDSFYNDIGHTETHNSLLDDGLYRPVFAEDSISTILRAVASSDQAIVLMRKYLSDYESQSLFTDISMLKTGDYDQYNTTLYRHLGMESKFINCIYGSLVEQGKDADAEIKAWIGLGREIADETVGSALDLAKVNPVTSVGVSTLANSGLDYSQDELSKKFAHYEHDSTVLGRNVAEDYFYTTKLNYFNVLYQTGKINRNDLAEYIKKSKYKFDLDELFPRGNLPTKSQFDSDPNLRMLLLGFLDKKTSDSNTADVTIYQAQLPDSFRW